MPVSVETEYYYVARRFTRRCGEGALCAIYIYTHIDMYVMGLAGTSHQGGSTSHFQLLYFCGGKITTKCVVGTCRRLLRKKETDELMTTTKKTGLQYREAGTH